MTLPTSPSSLSLNEIHIEAGGSSGTTCSLNDADIRDLLGKSSGASMSFNEWYGASADPTTTITSFGSVGGSQIVWQSYTGNHISNLNYYIGSNGATYGTHTSRAALTDYGGHTHTHTTYYVKNAANIVDVTDPNGVRYLYDIGGWGFSDGGTGKPSGGFNITNLPGGGWTTHVDTGMGIRLFCHYSNTNTAHRCTADHNYTGYARFENNYPGSGIAAGWASNSYGTKIWGCYLDPGDKPSSLYPSSLTLKFIGGNAAGTAAYYIH